MEFLAEKIMPVAVKLGQNKYLTTLRDAFMLSFPLTMFGSLVVVVNNFPFLSRATQGTLGSLFGNGQNATMAIMSVFVTIGIGYYWSVQHEVDGIFGGVISLASFLILTPFFLMTETGEEVSGVLALDRLGAKGMFLGIIVAFISAQLYVWFNKKGFVIKMPEGVPPAVSKSFSALIPAIGTLSIFLGINAVVVGVFSANLHDIIYNVIQKPLTGLGTSLPGTIVAIFFVQFLWFFGLHGQVIVNSVFEPFWQANMLDNAKLTAESAAALAEKGHIVTKSFMDTFTVGLGGSGSTLIVVLMMAFMMKNKQYRDVGRLSLAPGIFNVNEPVIFGLPIVMNAAIFIPWLLAPLVSVLIAYLGFSSGIVPLTTGAQVPWTVPVVISGFLATNSIMGSLLQIVQMVVIGFLWFPFLKLVDKSEF